MSDPLAAVGLAVCAGLAACLDADGADSAAPRHHTGPGCDLAMLYGPPVSPGKKGQIVWTVNRAGEFEFACLIPGHFEAGMIGRISVR